MTEALRARDEAFAQFALDAAHDAGFAILPHFRAAIDIEDKGGTIAMGPHQVPTGEWILIGSDPLGAEFALVGKA